MNVIRRRRVPLGGTTFDVCVAGDADAPLVVLLHGFPQTADAWAGVLPTLVAAGYRVAAPDQRGYTPDTVAGDDAAYRLPALATDVADLATALGAARFSVVGHDWGGLVAWQLAAARPDRVRSIVAVSTPHPRALARALRGRDQRRRSAYVLLLRSPLGPLALGPLGGAGLRALLRTSGVPGPHRARYVVALRRRGVLDAALGWYRANDLRRLLAVGSVAVPTTLVWGRRDPALGPDAAESTGAHVTGPYRLSRLDAGHWLPERHADAVAAEIVARLHDEP